MSIGYACLTIGVASADFKTCIIKNATELKLLELIEYNLNSLENIIRYNIKNNIRLFRISSDLIPFGSNEVNNVPWWDIFEPKLLAIGKIIKNSGMRVSMHPGQYTVLNSQNPDVVSRAVCDLKYHTKVLDSLGVSGEHKIVLHIGGVYNEKENAIERFITNYNKLEEGIKGRLVIENDDKSYNVSDVLKISKVLNIPVIFDNLHNKLNLITEENSETYWIEECRKTWKEKDGMQKIHYSQQNPLKNPGSHSNTIMIDEFTSFYEKLINKDIDIMLEVKDKNLSAVKCINCIESKGNIKLIEIEWSKYKYTVLEKSPKAYMEIRKLLKNKGEYPAISFYKLLEEALQTEVTVGNAVNAAQHVWGYFKDIASDKEKSKFLLNIEKFNEKEISIKRIKNDLWKMAEKYNRVYLLDSYYFVI
ncbi:UV DNA damage repair endonuclease UvsE [Clostridium sp.]|uniref:UV DNA damage repair endonuclease UvsE n=1 Tax=Clostridium sp. TaxID=1506 RepID=UPI0026352A66|nr:UV DNA damage repair endonuclease UvsE [Clostridium sp.]